MPLAFRLHVGAVRTIVPPALLPRASVSQMEVRGRACTCVCARTRVVILFPVIALDWVHTGIWRWLVLAGVGAQPRAHPACPASTALREARQAQPGLTASSADFLEEVDTLKVSCGQKGIYYNQSLFVQNPVIWVI